VTDQLARAMCNTHPPCEECVRAAEIAVASIKADIKSRVKLYAQRLERDPVLAQRLRQSLADNAR
jgi:hypothetical protein